MPKWCSAAKASSHLPKACRTHCGRSAACRHEHRSDSLSAAFRNLDDDTREDLTRRYEALCAHYGMTPTRNNRRRRPRERRHREPARPSQAARFADALLLRGSSDFDDLAAYRCFIDEIVGRRNARHSKGSRSSAPRSSRCRPREPPITRRRPCHVTSSSGFVLRKVFYTVPSRLIGHRLRVRLYDDRLECFLGGTRLLTLRRGRRHAERQAWPRRRLSSRHPCAAPQADGAAQSGLSRPAVPAPRLSSAHSRCCWPKAE